MRFVKFVLLVLFFLAFMVFFVQNNAQLSTALELKFNMFMLNYQSAPIPFYMVMLLFFVCGALFSTLFFVIDRIRIGSQLREAQYKKNSLESELTALKAKQSTPVVSAPLASTSETAQA